MTDLDTAPRRTTCQRCGHSSDDHRFDDYTLRRGYNAMSPDAKCRCVGPDLRGCGQQCPDMVRPVEVTR